MITIIDPEIISKNTDILLELKKDGIDHLNGEPAHGWNYALDHVWIIGEMEQYLRDKRGQELVILDVGCGRSKLHNFLESKFNIRILGIDRPYGYCHQQKSPNIDYYEDFLELKSFAENSVDIVMWLSAIEHNKSERICELYQKSMKLLKHGGLFLATIALSNRTHWFEPSQQTNLSLSDSKNIFEENEVQYALDDIKIKYRNNVLFLREKYERRYEKYDNDDPAFVVGGVKKIKSATIPEKEVLNCAKEPTGNHQYLFVPSSDTHVHLMHAIVNKLDNAAFMIFESGRENADYYLKQLGYDYYSYGPGILQSIAPSIIILANDWGNEERQIVDEAKLLGIPTVCIQEGCLDFIDENLNRMLHADYAFLQGPVMQQYIRRKDNLIITGNPKYDEMFKIPTPDKPVVMINANFTYGVYEYARDQWVKNAVNACRELKLDFFVSRHPRDKGEYPPEYNVIESDAFKMSSQMEKASIILTRFSTIIYEAIIQGRGVVYYNPHNEPFRIFSEDDTGAIEIAESSTGLLSAINSAINGIGKTAKERDAFILKHCNTLNNDAAELCIKNLEEIAKKHYKRAVSDESQESTDTEQHEVMVSVIIPTYNRSEMVPDAVKSVLAQTLRDFEIIVVNDAGPEVEDIITALNEEDNITYARHSINRGLAAARNTGIRLSRGKYIAYLDDDDIFYPEHLETLVDYLENSEDRIAYTDACRAHQVLENGKYVTENKDVPFSQDFNYDQMLILNFVPVLCFIHEKACLEKTGLFDESLRVLEDWDMWIRMSRIYKMPHIKKITAEFRSRTDGSSMTDSGQETVFYKTERLIHQKYKKYSKDKPLVLDAQRRLYALRQFELARVDSLDKGNMLKHLVNEASRLITENKYSEAIDAYSDLIIKYPQIDTFYTVLCDLYYITGRRGLHREWIVKAAKFDSSYVDSLIDMGLKFLDAGQYEDSEGILSALKEATSGDDEDLKKLQVLQSELQIINKQGAVKMDGTTDNFINEICNSNKNVEDKKASIIIPVFNNANYTMKCLEALALNTEYEPYEVIVVDNASTDETKEILSTLEGDIKIITNSCNLGFSKACNQGAKAAEGEYLIFLNNDTIPQSGWLNSLVNTVNENKDIAIAGSKLLYPDNTIQHAGVVFNVSDVGISIYHIYKGFDREAPAVNRVREFNAVTAACMLIRKNIFTESGMFDETFVNGYEDVDLCLKVREKGYRIIYNPESELYHYEEQTKGRFSHGEHNSHHLLNRWNNKIKTDDQTIALNDGYRIEFLPDNSVMYHRIDGVYDKAEVKKDEYFRQERTDVEALIPKDVKRILDVGCGEGILGKRLIEKGAVEVVGIEINPGACNIAERNLTKVINGDIEIMDLPLMDGSFDCIIFADILEHLIDPLSILIKLRRYLSDDGIVVASIPNIGLYKVINMLADGEWRYGESGILDKTHLRFFTKKEFLKLLSEAGYEMTGISVNIDSEFNNIANSNSRDITFGRVILRDMMPNEIEDLFVVQYLISAKKSGNDIAPVDKEINKAIETGDPEAAKQTIESYLELHPVDMNMLYKHAEVCLKLGEKENAEESLQKILIFYPEKEDALKMMQDIKGNGISGNELERRGNLNKSEDTERECNNRRKVAVVRGASLNKWEMQNYEALTDSYDITAYTTTQGYFDTEKIKLPIVKLPFQSQGLLLHMEGLEDKLASSDLVYSADITYEFSAQAVKAKERYGCKVVCLEWENIPFNHEEHDVIRRIKDMVRFGADYFIAVTERAKEALLIEGIAEDKIDVVPMGIDLERFRPSDVDDSDYREQLGIENGGIVILFIGRMVWEKGVYDLVHAAGKILGESAFKTKSVRFIMAGRGPELEALRERAERLGILDNIIFLENTPYHEIHKLHNIADIFVLPSISTQNWQEQFGMVLIESMACGKAVISTRSGSISEVVGDAGILVQPNDHLSLYNAIKEVICNKELRDTLGRKALLRARQEFDSKRTAEKVKEVFEKVLSRKSIRDEVNEYCDQGMKYLEQGNKEKAFEFICNAFQQDPDNKTILDTLVRTGMSLNKPDVVERSLGEYLLCHPANIDALSSLAEALIEQEKMAEAERELQKVFLFDRDNAKAAALMDKMKAGSK
jgi:GT2 family glycosyltransferase/glycosyltransferase involved in cell wall biosynthesis/ubiquinone/menaquinone biosynthesis C-methylase UbiE/TolA-binding protein